MRTAEDYDAWYQTTRGSWIGQQEFSTLVKLFSPKEGQSLLDVGCGTGHFSQHFYQLGMQVTGLDPDVAMIDFAKAQESQINYIKGDAVALPFADNSFDYCSAITSLCFVAEPEKALSEMLRVSRHGVMLGLLNRHSLLYNQKKNSLGYKNARWDSKTEVIKWCNSLSYKVKISFLSSIWFSGAGKLARQIEKTLPNTLPYGGFLAVGIKRE